jgi:hypothetical protein
MTDTRKCIKCFHIQETSNFYYNNKDHKICFDCSKKFALKYTQKKCTDGYRCTFPECFKVARYSDIQGNPYKYCHVHKLNPKEKPLWDPKRQEEKLARKQDREIERLKMEFERLKSVLGKV